MVEYIFLPSDHFSRTWGNPWNFHAQWTLDGWNDHIIQPALDAVLDYYKVSAPRSLPTLLVLKHTRTLSFSESALCRACRCRKVQTRQQPILGSMLYPSSRFTIAIVMFHIVNM